MTKKDFLRAGDAATLAASQWSPEVQAELDAHQSDRERGEKVHLDRIEVLKNLPKTDEAEGARIEAEIAALTVDLERFRAGSDLYVERLLARHRPKPE